MVFEIVMYNNYEYHIIIRPVQALEALKVSSQLATKTKFCFWLQLSGNLHIGKIFLAPIHVFPATQVPLHASPDNTQEPLHTSTGTPMI